MNRQRVRSVEHLGWLDFTLAGAAASAAVYSAGLGLAAPRVGGFFVGLVALGSLFSILVHRFMPTNRLGPIYGIPYAAALLGAAFVASDLNALLPDGGFPRELLLGGVLCWMLAAGAFTAWRDGTLLFQIVPGIAMFGMVGTWDTYRDAPLMFFGFLLCVAALFGRAHARSMLEQAREAGFLGPDGEDAASIQAIRAGPWRWMAGPEWALASAAVVVVVSLLGAPLLQESVKGVSGIVSVNVPLPKTPPAATPFQSSSPDSVDVGQGPRPLGDRVVLRASLDRQRYLRSQIFDTYTGSGWRSHPTILGGMAPSAPAVDEIPVPAQVDFQIELVSGNHTNLPAPGVVTSVSGMRRLRIRADGTVQIGGLISMAPIIAGRATVPANETRIPLDTPAGLPGQFGGPFLEVGIVPKRVIEFAQTAARGATSDYEKALAIKSAIEDRCLYDLYAKAVPRDEDAVGAFLFGEKRGYCDLFASAMAMLARSVGIPARYVVGYYPFQETVDGRGRYNVRESDAHAWTELYFRGVGWVVFDATEGAALAEGSERGHAVSVPWYATPWGMAGLAVLLLGGVGGGVWRARRPTLDPVALRRREVVAAYRGFLHGVERATRKPRSPAQTPREYLVALAPKLGRITPECEALNARLEAALFGRSEPSEAEAQELAAAVAALRRALREPAVPAA